MGKFPAGKPNMKRVADLEGKVFGNLRVTGYAGKDRHRKARWWVYCETCTGVKWARGDNLVSGKTTSCGCHRRYKAHVQLKAWHEWKRKMLADPEMAEMLADPEFIEFLLNATALSKLVTKSPQELVTNEPPV
jgi:hypothetical protein